MIRWTRLARHTRSIPAAVAMVVLLLLAISFLIIFQNESSYRMQKVREATVQAQILAASVTAALDFNDAPTARESVNALRVNPQILAAGVYDRDGHLFVSYHRQGAAVPQQPVLGAERKDIVEVLLPVRQGGTRIGAVYLSTIQEPVTRRITRYKVLALLVMMAALSIVILGIAAAALRRANRDLGERATALGEAYRQLQVESDERIHAEEQLRQAQKMQALGQLTGGIAHDFNNLLTVIQGSADVLRRPTLEDEKRLRFAEAIVQAATRAAALTGQLLSFARRQPLRAEVIDVNHAIVAMHDLLDRTLGEPIRVVTDLAPGTCAVDADPAQLETALLNVAVNARDAMPQGGVLTIRTERATLGDDRGAVAISFIDTGMGIDPELLGRVFEPFFTTKPVGKGTGLGLSQVYGFATQSGGEVRLSSVPGEGTTVTIALPCSDGTVEQRLPATERETSHRTGAILVVDDNEEVGAFAEALLSELGHAVVRARSGAEGLALTQEQRFDAILTDVVMPSMDGLELAAAIRERFPAMPIVLTTGYSDQLVASGSDDFPVVFKPYRLETLASALDKALAGFGRGDRI